MFKKILEAVEWSENEIIEELVKYFMKENADRDKQELREEIEETLDLSDGRYSSWGEAGKVEVDGQEYNIICDEDEAERIAREIVKQDLQEQPESFTRDWLEGFVDTSRFLDDLRADIESWVEESPESYITEEPEGEDGEYTEEQKRKAVDEYLENIEDQGVINWLEKELGYSGDQLFNKISPYLDVNEAAENAVNTDGWAHFLSLYDGDYDTTDNGLVIFKE